MFPRGLPGHLVEEVSGSPNMSRKMDCVRASRWARASRRLVRRASARPKISAVRRCSSIGGRYTRRPLTSAGLMKGCAVPDRCQLNSSFSWYHRNRGSQTVVSGRITWVLARVVHSPSAKKHFPQRAPIDDSTTPGRRNSTFLTYPLIPPAPNAGTPSSTKSAPVRPSFPPPLIRQKSPRAVDGPVTSAWPSDRPGAPGSRLPGFRGRR